MVHSGTNGNMPESDRTFDAVVHFVQSVSGTGVHVVSVDDGSGRGSGSVLTCAHVVSADDDNGDGKGNRPPPNRLGRQKVIMFPSGRTFITEYKVVVEASDGIVDVAAMMLVIKIHADPPPHRRTTTKTQQGWCHNNDRTTTEGGSLRIERR